MRIVLTCWGSYGDLFPYLGLAVRLKAQGHRPVLATCPYYRPIAEAAGIEFHPVPPDVDPDNTALIRRVMDARRGPEVVIREMVMPSLREQFDELGAILPGADVLVSHPVTFAAPILAEEKGVRWLSTVLAPLSFFSVTDFPALPNAPFTVHTGKIGTWAPRLLKAVAKQATREWTRPVQQLRVSRGLALRGDPIFEGQFSPHGTLALFSRVLAEPQPDWPSRTHVTGFVFYNGPGAALPPDLASFLDAGDPPVVFTLGSSAVGAPGAFYEESARAAQLLGVRAVLLVGPKPENRPRGPLPSTIHLAEMAPHELLFPRASAIVHHGGVGTTGQALRSGRPMVVVPYSHDQPDNAYRVRRLGVSRVLYPKQYRADTIAAELRMLLDGPSYRERAAIIARTVAAENGLEAASRAILNSEF